MVSVDFPQPWPSYLPTSWCLGHFSPSPASKKRWNEMQASQPVSVVSSVWIYKCLLSTCWLPGWDLDPACKEFTIQPQKLEADRAAPAARSQGFWPELIIKEWIIQEKALDSLCLGGRAAHTKVGAQNPTVHTRTRRHLEMLEGEAGWGGRKSPASGGTVYVFMGLHFTW